MATTISSLCTRPVTLKPSADPDERPPFWSLKPWWCQPWSILGTGLLVVAGSWMLLQRLWITLPLAAAVLIWWLLFLALVPAAYRSADLPE